MDRRRRLLARAAPRAGVPAVATLDDEVWERVGRLLVARGLLTTARLESAVTEARLMRRPLDEVLVARRDVSRQAVAAAVLVVQLGRGWPGNRRRASSLQAASSGRRRLPDVPVEPTRPFVLACLAVDVAVVLLAVGAAAVARSGSSVSFPPAGWLALFAILGLGLYWAWRLPTIRTRLRPWADAALLAGSTGVAALAVLTLRSLSGKSGVAEGLLPLWAFVTVYAVSGRMALYLAWPVAEVAPDPPLDGRLRQGRDGGAEERARRRSLEVVPIRPELRGVLDELRREVDAVGGGRRDDVAAAG